MRAFSLLLDSRFRGNDVDLSQVGPGVVPRVDLAGAVERI